MKAPWVNDIAPSRSPAANLWSKNIETASTSWELSMVSQTVMKIEKLFALAFVAMFVVIGTIVPSSAAKFSAEKYFKQPAAAMAIVIAVQSLSGCEEEVTFSEEAKTEEGAKYLIVSVTCPKVETEPGKFGTQTTKVTFEDIEGRLDVTDFSYE